MRMRRECLGDLQEGQLMLQYYYASNGNKHVNKKDEEGGRTNDYLTLLQWFLQIYN